VNTTIATRLVVAALAGLAVGIEREWSGHSSGPQARFAGIRTFLMLGGVGGSAGWLAFSGSVALAVAILGGAAALIVAAYVAAARRGGDAIEGTTEVAALTVLVLGTLAGFGFLEIASGATAVVVLALSEKERLRGIVTRIGSEEMRAGFQFAVLALVILPILPDETYGPLGGIRPRALWIVVLVFSALNFVAYVARRAIGEDRGYGVTGTLGGALSSTMVSYQFSRRSREEEGAALGLAVGVVGACTVLLPRLFVLSAVLNYPVALALLPFFVPPFLAGVALVGFALARKWSDVQSTNVRHEQPSPLRLWSAIKMAAAFQVSLMALSAVNAYLGAKGVLASAAVLGLTDMDALTLSMNRLGSTPDLVPLAARAIAVGVVANSALKLGLVLALGGPRYRRLAAAGIGLLTVASVVMLVVLW
jgi:uncharacterized membrane protein (DUF4010 family)